MEYIGETSNLKDNYYLYLDGFSHEDNSKTILKKFKQTLNGQISSSHRSPMIRPQLPSNLSSQNDRHKSLDRNDNIINNNHNNNINTINKNNNNSNGTIFRYDSN